MGIGHDTVGERLDDNPASIRIIDIVESGSSGVQPKRSDVRVRAMIRELG